MIPLKRYPKFGVGKSIGGKVYLHRQYEHLLPSDILVFAKEQLPEDFDYTVVSFDTKSHSITFSQSFDFDTAPEPTIGVQINVQVNGKCSVIKPNMDNPWIYHHKWLFVDDNYTKFDIEESRDRSESWNNIHGIDHSRIGKKRFWEQEVLPLLQ